MKKVLYIASIILFFGLIAWQNKPTQYYAVCGKWYRYHTQYEVYFWGGSQSFKFDNETQMLNYAAALGWELDQCTCTYEPDGNNFIFYYFKK